MLTAGCRVAAAVAGTGVVVGPAVVGTSAAAAAAGRSAVVGSGASVA